LKVFGNTARSRRTTATFFTLLVTIVATDFARAQSDSRATTVAIVYTAKTRYVLAAAEIETALQSQGLKLLSIELPSKTKSVERAAAIARLIEFDPVVIATGGVASTKLALAELPDATVVFFMVPNALDTSFVADETLEGGRVAGVTSDVAPSAQIAWIKTLLPSVSHLTVLAGDRTKRTARALQEAGARRGLRLDVLQADRNAFPAAIDALTSSGTGGVLMVPDARVYNSATVQRLLVWGARRHKPVWAFSQNIVRAGAIGGTFADTASVGKQAADVIQRILKGESAASIGLQYTDDIQRAVNERTANVIEAAINYERGDTTIVRFPDQ